MNRLCGRRVAPPATGALDRLIDRRQRAAPDDPLRRLAARGLVQQRVEARSGTRLQLDGQPVASFVSAGYLGLDLDPDVAAAACRAAERFGTSLATPRLLATEPFTLALERAAARLVGAEAARVFPSTTHVALDVIPLLAGERGLVLIDADAYPISRLGAQVARACGAALACFPHGDLRRLDALLRAHRGAPDKVIVCDGVYPAGGTLAPLPALVRLAARHGAVVYVDDAHGIGVLGRDPRPSRPYGTGGGGTPAFFFGRTCGECVHVASLSKAFGVPVAFVAGPARFVELLRRAPSLSHSSPPALPVLAAAIEALRLNATRGELLRLRLCRNVARFRRGAHGLLAPSGAGGFFPIQTIPFADAARAEAVAARLRRSRVWPVLQVGPADHPRGAVVRFLLTARHRRRDIARALAALAALAPWLGDRPELPPLHGFR